MDCSPFPSVLVFARGNAMLHLDVYSDIVCPWCYIGRARLAKALEGLPFPVEVRHRPFELQPDMPAGGTSFREHLGRKFGGGSRMDAAFAHVASEGAKDGLVMRFDLIEKAPNTRAAHRLVWLAGEHDKGDAMLERLTRGYFSEGKDVGDAETLGALGREVLGDDAGAAIDDAVRGVRGEAEVRGLLEHASELGVSGVPLFVVGDRLAVSGAQPPELLREFLEEVRERGLPGASQAV